MWASGCLCKAAAKVLQYLLLWFLDWTVGRLCTGTSRFALSKASIKQVSYNGGCYVDRRVGGFTVQGVSVHGVVGLVLEFGI